MPPFDNTHCNQGMPAGRAAADGCTVYRKRLIRDTATLRPNNKTSHARCAQDATQRCVKQHRQRARGCCSDSSPLGPTEETLGVSGLGVRPNRAADQAVVAISTSIRRTCPFVVLHCWPKNNTPHARCAQDAKTQRCIKTTSAKSSWMLQFDSLGPTEEPLGVFASWRAPKQSGPSRGGRGGGKVAAAAELAPSQPAFV